MLATTMSVRVKICGVTSAADAMMAVEAGADALGFMFYPPSPRHISVPDAASIIGALPPLVAKVGVFVNPSEDEVRRAIEQAGLDTLQFHGEESVEFCRRFGLKVMKGFRMRDESSLAAMHGYDREAWLLDAYVAGQPGGTGARFNWKWAQLAVARGGRVILAGGLTPENAAAAVREVRPYGLDVSSGVESAPGRKDPVKVRQFILAAKTACCP